MGSASCCGRGRPDSAFSQPTRVSRQASGCRNSSETPDPTVLIRAATHSTPSLGQQTSEGPIRLARMSESQLWLFPHPKPLVERFGNEFFRQLPSGPGVYLFCGPNEGVLYVGKARNLRRRLSSYRVANPERHPRRIIRLLNRVTRIEWDECPTEFAASCREELLIAVLQPRFNFAGKVWPRSDI